MSKAREKSTDSQGYGAGRGFGTVETGGNGVSERDEGRCGGAEGAETVLGVRRGEVLLEVREEESLHDLCHG